MAANRWRLDIRRLAAVDMYGGAGTRLRRRLILAEFVLGALAGPAVGGWVTTTATSIGWQAFGLWVVGVGLNYVPLTLHAATLTPAGRLEAALAGVDVPAELRHYTVAQLWVLVPLTLVVLAVRQAVRTRRA